MFTRITYRRIPPQHTLSPSTVQNHHENACRPAAIASHGSEPVVPLPSMQPGDKIRLNINSSSANMFEISGGKLKAGF